LANLGVNWGMLLLQGLIFLGIALWLLKRRDIIRKS
jgi:hypothetical protein